MTRNEVAEIKKELAEAVGSSVSMLGKVLIGKRNYGLSKAKKFSSEIGSEWEIFLDPGKKDQRTKAWRDYLDEKKRSDN